MIVLDASVAAKWFLPETGQEAAHRLLAEGNGFIAPTLIRIEVAAAILRRVRMGTLEEADARFACEKWRSLLDSGILDLIPDVELFALATELAFQIRHTLQDCLYLAAGKAMNADVITADDTMVERGRGVWDRVRLL